MLSSPLEHFGFQVPHVRTESYMNPIPIASTRVVATRAGPHLGEMPKGPRQFTRYVSIISGESQPRQHLRVDQLPVDLDRVFSCESVERVFFNSQPAELQDASGHQLFHNLLIYLQNPACPSKRIALGDASTPTSCLLLLSWLPFAAPQSLQHPLR